MDYYYLYLLLDLSLCNIYSKIVRTILDKMFEKQRHSSGVTPFLVHVLVWSVLCSMLPTAIVAIVASGSSFISSRKFLQRHNYSLEII